MMANYGLKILGTLMEFLYLGNVIDLFPYFLAKGNFTALILNNSTLSPKEPNFPAWWEEHKSEWEAPVNSD